MRRLVAAAFVAALAVTLVGCGGGGGEQAAAPTDQAAAPAPVTPGQAALTTIPDRSVQESRTFEPFPKGEDIPKEVSDKVAAKQPILLFFFDGAQLATNDQRAQIDSVLADNRGLVDLVAYDVGKYASVDTSGVVKTDPKILNDEKLRKGVLLARTLKVTYTPYIVMVDEQGYITYRMRGPVDAGLLEPEVLRAAK